MCYQKVALVMSCNLLFSCKFDTSSVGLPYSCMQGWIGTVLFIFWIAVAFKMESLHTETAVTTD
jgi:hypothetical protein